MSAKLEKLCAERDQLEIKIDEQRRKDANKLQTPSEKIRRYLLRMDSIGMTLRMDDIQLDCDGSAELTHDEAKNALRDVYLISCGEKPEHNNFI